jgi:hypothetical protein
MGLSHPTRPGVRKSRWAALAALVLASAAAQAEGLVLHAPENPLRAPIETLAHAHMPSTSIHLVGDYYFFDPARNDFGPALGSFVGGFRASTGVAGFGQPMSLFESQPDASQNAPYLGLGYSHLWFHSQLSLNADFGLASQNPSAAGHLRGLLNGSQSLDDVTRELRWAPVMAVNVSYSF